MFLSKQQAVQLYLMPIKPQVILSVSFWSPPSHTLRGWSHENSTTIQTPLFLWSGTGHIWSPWPLLQTMVSFTDTDLSIQAIQAPDPGPAHFSYSSSIASFFPELTNTHSSFYLLLRLIYCLPWTHCFLLLSYSLLTALISKFPDLWLAPVLKLSSPCSLIYESPVQPVPLSPATWYRKLSPCFWNPLARLCSLFPSPLLPLPPPEGSLGNFLFFLMDGKIHNKQIEDPRAAI